MTEETKSCCAHKGGCKPNVGKADRVARIVVGLGLISLIFVGPHTLWGLLGVPLVATGILGWCGAYTLLGINTTCKTNEGGCCATKDESAQKPEGSCCGGHCHGDKPAA